LDLEKRTCTKLEKYYKKNIGQSYFTSANTVEASSATDLTTTKFDVSNSIFKNYYVKSAYNCCCGDGYKNNFVAICALEKCIALGCRFLDFEIYSYNNEPIIAASTANSNYIKETYNSLLLEEASVVWMASVVEASFAATFLEKENEYRTLNIEINDKLSKDNLYIKILLYFLALNFFIAIIYKIIN
jgi:hypothetical protein